MHGKYSFCYVLVLEYGACWNDLLAVQMLSTINFHLITALTKPSLSPMVCVDQSPATNVPLKPKLSKSPKVYAGSFSLTTPHCEGKAVFGKSSAWKRERHPPSTCDKEPMREPDKVTASPGPYLMLLSDCTAPTITPSLHPLSTSLKQSHHHPHQPCPDGARQRQTS